MIHGLSTIKRDAQEMKEAATLDRAALVDEVVVEYLYFPIL